MIRVLLIDDEPLARRRLRQLLAQAPDFDVVGESGDAREAADLVERLRPDVVFLDIRMPHLDGFGVRSALRKAGPRVVFVTAHPGHAARAFDVAASDYLVKPVTQARFDDALARLRRDRGGDDAPRILLGGRRGGATPMLTDIVWLEAHGAYVRVHVRGRSHVVRESLYQLLDRLGAATFLRVHRSAAVNAAHVTAVAREKDGLVVVLASGHRVPVSRRRAADVVARLRTPP